MFVVGIGFMLVIENVSILVLEDEFIVCVLEWFDYILDVGKCFFYIILIYYIENCFGGGNYIGIGFKFDGE